MDLAKQSSFLNRGIIFLSNQPIVEYDMKDAGISLIIKYKLLPKETIKELKQIVNSETSLTKKKKKALQNIAIGKLQRVDKNLSKMLPLCFEMERKEFIEKNQLSKEDIISIKKDAFFLSTNKKISGNMGGGIVFRKKNEYSSYLLIDNLEIYYSRDKLDIKGIGDVKLSLHEKYMCDFIKKAFYSYETRELSSTLMMMRMFFDDYVSLKLESGYYRELNAMSKFHYMDGEKTYYEYRNDKQQLNIFTNFNIIKMMILYFTK